MILNLRKKVYCFDKGHKKKPHTVEKPKKRQYRTLWFAPPSKWPENNNSASQASSKEKKRFGGIVQQKLDEIAAKRKEDE